MLLIKTFQSNWSLIKSYTYSHRDINDSKATQHPVILANNYDLRNFILLAFYWVFRIYRPLWKVNRKVICCYYSMLRLVLYVKSFWLHNILPYWHSFIICKINLTWATAAVSFFVWQYPIFHFNHWYVILRIIYTTCRIS